MTYLSMSSEKKNKMCRTALVTTNKSCCSLQLHWKWPWSPPPCYTDYCTIAHPPALSQAITHIKGCFFRNFPRHLHLSSWVFMTAVWGNTQLGPRRAFPAAETAVFACGSANKVIKSVLRLKERTATKKEPACNFISFSLNTVALHTSNVII